MRGSAEEKEAPAKGKLPRGKVEDDLQPPLSLQLRPEEDERMLEVSVNVVDVLTFNRATSHHDALKVGPVAKEGRVEHRGEPVPVRVWVGMAEDELGGIEVPEELSSEEASAVKIRDCPPVGDGGPERKGKAGVGDDLMRTSNEKGCLRRM